MTFWNLVTFPSWKSLLFCKSECISSSSCLSADSLVTHCWTLHWCERSGKWENSGWALRLYLLYSVQGALKHWSIADCGFYCFLSCSKEPGQQRVKRWGFGMDEALKDPVGREQFLKFLESEFSSENLRWKTLCFSSSQDTSYFLVNIFFGWHILSLFQSHQKLSCILCFGVNSCRLLPAFIYSWEKN